MAKKEAKKTTKATKKTTKKATKKTAKKAGEMLLVASKTKEILKGHGLNVAGDALEGLNTYVHWLLGQAAARAAANGRKTVRPHDFILG